MTLWFWGCSDNINKRVMTDRIVHCSKRENSGTKAYYEGFEEYRGQFTRNVGPLSIDYTTLHPRGDNTHIWDKRPCST
jgi:hypothetical protein